MLLSDLPPRLDAAPSGLREGGQCRCLLKPALIATMVAPMTRERASEQQRSRFSLDSSMPYNTIAVGKLSGLSITVNV